MKASEMDCHRLKAILAGTMMKCIRKPAFGKVFEYESTFPALRGQGADARVFWQMHGSRVEPRYDRL